MSLPDALGEPPCRPENRENWELVRRLKAKGAKNKDIAAETGVSLGTVDSWCAGMDHNKKGGRELDLSSPRWTAASIAVSGPFSAAVAAQVMDLHTSTVNTAIREARERHLSLPVPDASLMEKAAAIASARTKPRPDKDVFDFSSPTWKAAALYTYKKVSAQEAADRFGVDRQSVYRACSIAKDKGITLPKPE